MPTIQIKLTGEQKISTGKLVIHTAPLVSGEFYAYNSNKTNWGTVVIGTLRVNYIYIYFLLYGFTLDM